MTHPLDLLMTFAGLLVAAAPARVADPLQQAHDRGDSAHLLSVMKIDSSIETMNKGTVDVFGLRREFRCPSGELVSETRCDPCTYSSKNWGEPPAGQWVYDMAWESENERSHAVALARLDHFRLFFELAQRAGSEKGGQRHAFFAYAGRLERLPEPARALRVRMLVSGAEVSAATIPAGVRQVEVEARAQKKGPSGALEDFPDAAISFASDCGTARPAGAGRVAFSLAPGVARCELRASAQPGDATAAIGVRREVSVEITFEDHPADQIVVRGQDFVDLSVRSDASGKPVSISPEWTVTGARLERLDPSGTRVKVRLDEGSAEAEVKVLDALSGAAARLVIRRKP